MIEPLTLAVGSHQAGTGRACAMNIISWENGDSIITDMPACTDLVLGSMVMTINDAIGDAHVDGLLPAPWGMKVMDLAHATVGTTNHNLTDHALAALRLRYMVEHVERKVEHVREQGGTGSGARMKNHDAAFIDMVKDSVRLFTEGSDVYLHPVRWPDYGGEAREWFQVHEMLRVQTTNPRVASTHLSLRLLDEADWGREDRDYTEQEDWDAMIARTYDFIAEFKRDMGITVAPVVQEVFEAAYEKAMVVAE